MRTTVLLVLLALCACTPAHELTACRGSFQPANPGRWAPLPGDLSGGDAR